MQGKRRYGTLVAQVEDNVVVGWQAVMIPHQFGGHYIARTCHHEPLAVRIQLEIMLVEPIACRVGKLQCAAICGIDIGEIGRIGEGTGTLQAGRGQVFALRMLTVCPCQDGRKGQQYGKEKVCSLADAVGQTEGEDAPLPYLALYRNIADGKEGA